VNPVQDAKGLHDSGQQAVDSRAGLFMAVVPQPGVILIAHDDLLSAWMGWQTLWSAPPLIVRFMEKGQQKHGQIA
jgi:hypothetical protein